MNHGPRVQPVAEPHASIAGELQTGLSGSRPASNLIRTLAHNPSACRGFRGLGRSLFLEGKLTDRAREVVVLRVAWNCRSSYEFGNHAPLAAAAGLSEAEIAALACTDPIALPTGERILVDVVDEMCATDNLSDFTWERLSTGWSESELVELVTLVGFYRSGSNIANVLRVDLEEGLPGWPSEAHWPEQRSP